MSEATWLIPSPVITGGRRRSPPRPSMDRGRVVPRRCQLAIEDDGDGPSVARQVGQSSPGTPVRPKASHRDCTSSLTRSAADRSSGQASSLRIWRGRRRRPPTAPWHAWRRGRASAARWVHSRSGTVGGAWPLCASAICQTADSKVKVAAQIDARGRIGITGIRGVIFSF